MSDNGHNGKQRPNGWVNLAANILAEDERRSATQQLYVLEAWARELRQHLPPPASEADHLVRDAISEVVCQARIRLGGIEATLSRLFRGELK